MDKRYFDNLLKDRGISLRGLAKRLDILPSQLSLTFTGKRRMQLDEAVRIGQILGVSLHDVAIHAGISSARSDVKRVRVTGILRGDGTVAEQTALERTPTPISLPENAEAVHARTADTPLSWMDGWVLFTDERSPPSDGMLGRYCRAKIQGGPEVMCTIRRGYKPNTYNLSGPYVADSQRLEWLAPVIVTRH